MTTAKIVAGRASTVFDPYELLGALQARNVSFVVIGAFARVVRGTREVTDGIDITPSMRGENLARLQQALEDLDAGCADGEALDLRNLAEPVAELETRAGVLKLVPGLGKQLQGVDVDEKQLARVEAIVLSMTPQERRMPHLISTQRRRRIAAGSGTSLDEVNKLMAARKQMAKMMKQMGKGKMPAIPGMPPPGRR